ncbi:glycoside hydrolase family 13 protein [Nitrosovibrio tenuis]|uniref:Oligo-1,6-glucosidase/alpha-glucosidase n=1 Tax=Nitrosovibrio tenuis TaxID=1233 RepID=A0A1H7NHQ6_9PROT|nr:alpha-glucosidase [Nitrosovibrio tenuis]SEL22924.1 oligo-1,6-glucosidase/alpha-glucosidase [Nitrosovibrio tenuis]
MAAESAKFTSTSHSDREWWKKTTVYQIYPRSFFDSNDDGVGDIPGIIEKLDYLEDLGYETIWISPFTQSPQRDFGYDISDYFSISPEYGDMALFEKLVREVHARRMKLVFDLVLNHTSNEHPWFKESASSRDNPKADWYIWKDGTGKNGTKPPNNWRAMAGNKAWTYYPERKQFNYTAFLPFQPDLNYHNPDVKRAMFDVVRFWLNKGVDGFRLDIISAIYEDSTLRKNPPSFRLAPSDKSLSIFFQHLKNNFLHEKSFVFATELRSVVDEFANPKRVLIGESHGDEAVINRFCYLDGKDGLDAIFLFKAVSTPFKAESYRQMLMKFEKHFPEPLIPTLVFANHDRTRVISRLGGSIEKAKLLALFQFTCRGIPFTYFGDEIGIPRVRIPLKQGKDAIAMQLSWIPQALVDRSIEILNRDECRTPMLWNSKPNAGFCDHATKPWLPVAENFNEINVEKQVADPCSLFNFYKKLIRLRNATPALHGGSLEIAHDLCDKKILAYYRISDDEKYMVVLNMSKYRVENPVNSEVLLSTHPQGGAHQLHPFEGRVMRLRNT